MPFVKRKKPKLPASYEPHECIVLAVDTAETSGWAVYAAGELVNWGEVDMMRPERSRDRWGVSGWDANRVCMHALVETGHDTGWPVVMVFERPFRGTTQGQWIGAWKLAFLHNGGHKNRIIGVYPASWRARVLRAANAPREQARKSEMDRARQESSSTHWIGPDAAAAICIGLWAVRSGDVAAKLPKKRTRKAEVA